MHTTGDILTQCTLAVLAGGQGSRMGQPKAELRINGQLILPYLLDRFRWPGPTLLVTAPGRTAPPGADRFDAEATDPIAGLGPLRGVLTALEQLTTKSVLITTVDMPALEHEHLGWYVEQLAAKPEAIGLMAQRTLGDEKQIEPFPSAFRREAASLVQSQLDVGRRSVYRLSSEPGVLCIPAPAGWPDDVWTNLNVPADVESFHQRG